MKITIDLPDELLRKVEVIAASRGQSLEQFAVENGRHNSRKTRNCNLYL
jgi:metal-responsive CopG/Arc/MetJ family transcriptional regulator